MKQLLIVHFTALACGCFLDLLIGDPHGIWHPVSAIGSLIAWLERRLMTDEGAIRNPDREFRRGVLLCLIVTGTTVLVTAAVLFTARLLHPVAGMLCEAVASCYILAAKSLYVESRKVYEDLKDGDPERARRDLSMIVGRDTQDLSPEAVARAAVETVAENTSDGVIAPLLYTAVGGPVLGLLYKAVNTMDSMIGYHNDRYEFFGRAAAKLDDAVNYLPSRISALLMIAAAAIPGILRVGGKDRCQGAAGAFRIFCRDRRNHKSPNSAQTESACAGALGVELGGASRYQGILVEKPTIGDPLREIVPDDILRANRLMFAAEAAAMILIFCTVTIMLKVLP